MNKPKKKKMFQIFLILLILLVLPGLDQRLIVRYYQLDAEQIGEPVRIALITDLHSCKYGKDQQTLINAIDEQKPDFIALCGDIFDDVLPDDNTEMVIADISAKYPCWYVNGNHECWCTRDAFMQKMQILKDHHVSILAGEMETIQIRQEKINLCGVDDPDGYALSLSDTGTTDQQLQKLDQECQNGNYSILLSHRPELFPEYDHLHFDLILCGHAHGGQWRIPGILNGLYAPNQGLFPKYAGGEYQGNQVTMLVSRGLARESTKVPRFYNRPELVIIDLQ